MNDDDEDGSPDPLEPPAVCEDVWQTGEWPAGLFVHPISEMESFAKYCNFLARPEAGGGP